MWLIAGDEQTVAKSRTRGPAGRGYLAAAAAVFALATVALLSESLLTGKVLSPNDQLFQFAPFQEERPSDFSSPSNPGLGDVTHLLQIDLHTAREAVRSGELPLWDPWTAAGRPLLASQQAGTLYPLNAPAYVLPFWQSLEWLAALKLFFGALGMFMFCRALGLRPAAGILGGLAFAFGTGFVVWLEHGHAQVYAVVPWLFLCATRLTRTGEPIWALALAGALGIGVLGGHPESFFAAGVALAAFTVYRLWGEPRSTAFQRLSLFAGSLVLGAAAGAVAALPFLELVGQSYEVSREGPPDPLRGIYGLFFPEMWGRPDKIVYPGPTGGFAGRAFYVGAVPLLLAAAGLAARNHTRDQRFFAAAAILAALMMFDIPGWSDLVRNLPVLSLMYLHSFSIVLVVSLSVLAAAGLHRLLTEPDSRRRILIAMAAVVVVPMLWPLRHLGLLGELPDAVRELPVLGDTPAGSDAALLGSVLRWGLFGAGGLALAWVATRGRGRPALAVGALVALSAIDLVSLGRGYHPAVPEASARPSAPASVDYLKDRAAGARVGATGTVLPTNVAALYGLRDFRGESVPRIERYSRLWTGLGGFSEGGTGRHVYLAGDPRGADLRRLYGVRWLLGEPEAAPPAGATPIDGVEGTTPVLHDSGALQRAWLAYTWEEAEGLEDALRKTLARPASDLERMPVIEGAGAPAAGAPAEPGRAAIVRDEPARLEVETQSAAPAWLVLADTFYPGWRAEVDGRETPVRAANTAFRAVEIPPGRHTVTFEYRPASVRVGLLLSAAAYLLICGGSAFLVVSRGRSRRPAGP